MSVANIADKSEDLQPERERLAQIADRLWRGHSFYFELMGFDLSPLVRTLDTLNSALSGATEAKGWPLSAQGNRASPVLQLMSDLGGSLGNVRKDAMKKRKEYLE